MTYRRLFHILLIGSTLVLAGLWWQSFRSLWLLTAGNDKPPFTLFVGLLNANISLYLDDTPQPGWGNDFTSIPLAEGSPIYGALLPVYQKSSGLFGSFLWNYCSEESPGGFPDALCIVFPVWAPWLLFVGSAFAFCRVMERRSKGGREKALAEEQETGHS